MSVLYEEKPIERLSHHHRSATVYKTKRLFGPGHLFILRFDDGREEIVFSIYEAHRIYNMLKTTKLS
jgi:hypothetical protein